MIKWLEGLLDFFSPVEKYVKTTRGKVGRVEKEIGSTVVISFGSFNSKGKWVKKYEVTISQSDIIGNISKDQVMRELTIMKRTVFKSAKGK